MLDRIIAFALSNKLLILVITGLSTIFGFKAMVEMPIDVFPDLNRPTVTILTEAGGLAPEEVETLISTPIEAAMSGLPGVIRVRSASSVGLSLIWVEFDWGTDLLINRQLVNERLAILDEVVPSGVVPVMGPISSLMGEIMLVGLTGEGVAPMDVRTIADWTIKPRLQAISGISQIVPIGGGVRQLQILFDPNKLKKLGISLKQVREAVANIAINTTGGFVDIDYNEFLIRNIAKPTSIEEIALTPVTIHDGIPIKLGDVAEIKYGHQVKRGDAGVNGMPGVIMAIQKQPNVNTVTLTREIEVVLEELKTAMPQGVKIHELFKQANFIETAIANVEEALRDGSIFVAIVLFLFLLNFRTTAITLTAIPLSLVITFLVFKLFDITINTMTLGGLAVAIGELVDDAIVDVENVFRRLRENRGTEHPKPALRVIYEASSEVRNSIVIATFIVVLVFLPLFSLEGLEGRLFIPLGIAYVVSIFASLLVSLTVTPVLCAYLLPNAKATAHSEDGALVRWLKRMDRNLLERVLNRPKTVIAFCSALILSSIIAVAFMGKEFLPAFNEGTVTAFVVSPPGTGLQEGNRIGMIAEKQLLTIDEVVSTGRRIGRAEQDEHAEGVYNTEIDIDLRLSDRSRSEILGDMREKLKAIPGVGVSLGQPISHRIDHMMSGVKSQLAIKIFGDDLRTLRELAQQVETEIGGIPGLVDLQIEKMTVVPQIQIIADQQRASRFGLSAGDIAEWLEQALEGGHPVGELIDGQKRTAIVLRVDNSFRDNLEAIQNVYIDTPTGDTVPLHAVATVQKTTGPNAINHENNRRRIIVMANTHGRDLGSVANDVERVIKEHIKVPEGYFITLGGQFESQISATKSIAALSILSFLGIFLVLFLHFKSAFIALQVMLNIPLALIGSVVAVYITGGVFSIGTLVGFITLCGIASRNGIMMISHYIHLIQYEHHQFDKEMVIKGSLERLVPVLMTALTAALALIPIAIAGGEPGKEILHPVAVVILGGLISSTLLDIFVTPTIFYNYGQKSVKKSLAAIEKPQGLHFKKHSHNSQDYEVSNL